MSKREARERALVALYQMDVIGVNPAEALMNRYEVDEIKPIPLSKDLVAGVIEHQKEIDETITKYAKEWNILRFSNIDRNILRLAILEILHREAIPYKVSINEAVEMSKMYSTEDAYKFVNGILAQVVKEQNG